MDRVDHDSLEWLRASASMPIVTRPGQRCRRASAARRRHQRLDSFGLFPVTGLRPQRRRTDPATRLSQKPGAKWVFRLFMRRYPKIVEAMAKRHEMYNAQLDYIHSQALTGNTLIIAPLKPLPIGRIEMNPEKCGLSTAWDVTARPQCSRN